MSNLTVSCTCEATLVTSNISFLVVIIVFINLQINHSPQFSYRYTENTDIVIRGENFS